MQLFQNANLLSLSLYATVALAASQWSFEDATLTVQGKGSGVGSGLKEKLNPSSPLSKDVSLGATDILKIILTTTEGSKAKRPHQAFLTLTETTSGLEESWPFSVKEAGKGKVELSHKDLPTQFLTSKTPLRANLVVASFGSSTPYSSTAFNLDVQTDPNVPLAIPEPPERYGKKEEIHHIFRADPKSPNKLITLVFMLAVIAALPALFAVWLALGANVNHFSKAMGAAPVAHSVFFGSVVAMEGALFMYYTSWTLFQLLPVAIAIGAVAYVSGSKALTEVQERRLAGMR